MSAIPATTTIKGVTLLRLGQGKEEVELPEGSTLADLLQNIGADTKGLEILVDGKPIEACLVLQTGMIVSIGMKIAGEKTRKTWNDTVGMFRDELFFEEAVKEGRDYRDSLREAAPSNGDLAKP